MTAETLTLAGWREAGHRSSYRGHSIFYQAGGSGDAEALLCIHGFPTASWDWHPLWPALCARFRVIAPDMIGFGYSAKPAGYPYAIVDQATLIEALLAELGVTRAHVLAHDYGDTVAQELLARHEDRALRSEAGLVIASMCLLNGGLFPETHRPRLVQRALASPLGPIVGRLMNRRAFGRSMTAIFGKGTPPSRQTLDDLWTLVAHDEGPRVAHLLIGYMAERRRQRSRWVGALETTRVPLRLVCGLADPVSGAHMAVRYREVVPRPDVVELAGIGHYPQLEDPAGVLQAFVAFHERVASGAG